MKDVFAQLEEINSRPEPFEFYTAADLWTDEHTSKQMLRKEEKHRDAIAFRAR